VLTRNPCAATGPTRGPSVLAYFAILVSKSVHITGDDSPTGARNLLQSICTCISLSKVPVCRRTSAAQSHVASPPWPRARAIRQRPRSSTPSRSRCAHAAGPSPSRDTTRTTACLASRHRERASRTGSLASRRVSRTEPSPHATASAPAERDPSPHGASAEREPSPHGASAERNPCLTPPRARQPNGSHRGRASRTGATMNVPAERAPP
jgi:hypothetical protein